MRLLLFLSLLFLAAHADYDPDFMAKHIAETQVESMKEALKANDKDGFLKLLTTTKDDEVHYHLFSQFFQKVAINVTSARFMNGSRIDAHITAGEKNIPAVIVMERSSSSPTGWTVKAIGGQDLSKQEAQKEFVDQFDLCWIGLLMCALKYLFQVIHD